MLRYIGLDAIRCGAIQYAGAGSWASFEKAAKLGVRMSMTIRANRSPAENIADIERFAAKFPGIVIGIEGPNEIDHAPVQYNGMLDSKSSASGTPIAALAYQEELGKLVGLSKHLRDVPLLNFSDFAQSMQHGIFNTHPYPRNGALLSGALPGILKLAREQFAITETGAPSAPDRRFYLRADEQSQVRFVIDALKVVASEPRIASLFLYQLMDNYPQPVDPAADGMEYHFGLFRYDGTPKPAAEAVRRMVLG